MPGLPTHTPSEPRLLDLLLQLWVHLPLRRRYQLGALLMVMLASSAAEVLSLAAVLPFLAVLANPQELWNQPLVQQWAPQFGIAEQSELLLPITIAFALAAIGAGGIRLLNLWMNGRLAAAIGSDLSCETYERTLYQPYAVHLARNSSELISSISSDVNRVIYQLLNPLLLLISSVLIATSLIVTLLLIDALLALAVGLVVCLVYFFAMRASRRPLKYLGRRQVILNRSLIKALQEGLGAIRDVLLDGQQNFYASIYRQTDRPLRIAGADEIFLSTYPRLVLEPVGMALIAVAGYVLVRDQGVGRALPLLGALTLGSQRLLPIAQKVYEGWALTRASKDSLEAVLQLMHQPLPHASELTNLEHLPFHSTIVIKDVYFRYGPDLPEVLQRAEPLYSQRRTRRNYWHYR